MISQHLPTELYTDFSGFAQLKADARKNTPQALDKVARQFEAVFVQMALKSMREASFGDSLFDSDRALFYRDLYDKQLSLHLARNSGIGLADLIVRQLGGQSRGTQPASPVKGLKDYRLQPVRSVLQSKSQELMRSSANARALHSNTRTGTEAESEIGSPGDFINVLRPHAILAGRELGVDPGILLAQAALESGWGKRVIRHADGHSSHNLFGIKADQRWTGPQASVVTLEFRNGQAEKQRAGFRSYGSFSEGFQDYVRFIKVNPRYGQALREVGDPRAYLKELQKAGYATDPRYAEKVIRIFDRQGLDELSLGQKSLIYSSGAKNSVVGDTL